MTLFHPNIARPIIWIAAFAMVCGSNFGCHRQFYRKQADLEAHELIAEKASHVARPPNTAIRVEVDRRSRMFNPFDLDFQPMPLDDPASYRYMQCVDGRRGYPMWEAAGLTNTSESPDWWQFLPLDDDGVLVLNLENAVQIALLHSPEYQRQVEQLYLSALQVSAERFQFDTQFFGGANSFFTFDGDRRTGAGRSSSRFEFGPNSVGRRDLSLQRRFASGGELIVGVANNIVWELSGPNSQSATTVLDFTLLQPLLRNAGRDVVLENLTFAERALLANVRSFERYRRSFFLNVTVGRNTESEIGLGGGPNFPNVGGGGFGGAGGYLGLLQTQLRIRNLEENIARQTEALLIFEDTLVELFTTIPRIENADSIVRQQLNIAQARSNLLQSQSQLVNQQAGFQRSVDAFLRTLGLPPYICAKLNDPILDQFELIDRTLLTRREELSTLRANVGLLNVAILEQAEFSIDPETSEPFTRLTWTEDIGELLEELRQELEPLAKFNEALIEEDLPRIAKDIAEFADTLSERQEQNESLLEVYRTEQESICGLLNLSEIDESIFEIENLAELEPELFALSGKLAENLESYQERIEKLQASLEEAIEEGGPDSDPREFADQVRNRVIVASQDLLSDLGDDVLALQLIQARARTESVVLPQVDISPEEAFEIARNHRRDLANARAALVDSWRNIEVVADDLESSLDVVFSGDVQNVGNNPTRLRSSTGRLRMGLQWDAPITRLLERNAYRTALIQYERSKRNFYVLEDSIWQLLRSEIRQLQANRLTFELGRQSIRIAAAQIELNTDIRAINDARGQPAGATAARDSIDALNALLNAQNSLLDIFVNYEVVRRGLDFDLGTMEITPEGLWIEPEELSPELLLAMPGTTAGGMMAGECTECRLPADPLPPEPRFRDTLRAMDMGQATDVGSGIPDSSETMPQMIEQDDAPELVDPPGRDAAVDGNAGIDPSGEDAIINPNSEPVTIEKLPIELTPPTLP